jgi:hypothetical protein
LAIRCGVNGDGAVRYCECAELVICGVRVPMPFGHDCEYMRQRTALVAEAERIADGKGTDDPHAWMRRFVAAMDELSKPLLNGE